MASKGVSGVLEPGAMAAQGFTVERTDGAGNAVEHVAFEQCPWMCAQVRRLRSDDEPGKIVHNIVRCQSFSPFRPLRIRA